MNKTELDRRYDAIYTDVTLDGRLAVVTGVKLESALVRTIHSPELKVEFAWPTVYRIIANGGRFKS